MRKETKIGELRLHRDGYGFVTTGKKGEEDAFIPARMIGDALHTDLVEVDIVPGRGKKMEGRIRKILEHRMTKLVGRLEHIGRHFRVIADDRRVRHVILVPDDKLHHARHGQNVVVKILSYPCGGEPMLGEVIEILGERGMEDTEETAVMIHHQLSREFPAQVLAEAEACDSRLRSNNNGSRVPGPPSRRDLRNIDFVTIDGETARDFDDAVAVKRMDSKIIRLWVSIADVAHFVKERSALDREAYRRGTSVYFPADCLPMLPEQLSNDLCSLRPEVDRFTMTAQMDIDPAGNIVRSEFYPSIIKSRERMTYTAIRKILVEKDAVIRERYRMLLPSFDLMEECFNCLRAKRLRRGSIDFDLPEPQINIDLTGEIENIVKAERHVGHMIIEEFMIAANESVAEFLTAAKIGCIYRDHEHPDMKRIHEFAILIHNLGYQIKIRERVPPATLARVVQMVEGKPEQRLVNTSLLRSMAQAVYSEENIGHFGLASKCYCHFTSPIRRYPDLVVHRLLKIALAHKAKFPLLCKEGKGEVDSGVYPTHPPLTKGRSNLQEIAEHCSRRERIAMEAEREMVKVHVALFMKAKIGETFDGIISHVTKFGFFVELKEYFVEGLVHLESLPEDRYFFDERGYTLKGKRRKKAFSIGDSVRIIVDEVDIPSREVYFSLA